MVSYIYIVLSGAVAGQRLVLHDGVDEVEGTEAEPAVEAAQQPVPR